ncbi:hypothetical protein [Brevibacillus sp. Leaf182]|uniref:glycoside hydrolase family 78 protein n=1 Tax=Brevibacillus sp. Leaf182 TaxID=1736290 RepID=UPI0006F64351|nr:hypothetical protein [Brevibacillus sp. Leaf182]RAT99238.1 hypothetical protein ASG16_005995 [Brevibacillus sp. Leaf182]
MSIISKAYEALGVGTVISNAVLKKGDVVVTFATSGSSGVDVTATLSAGSMTQKYTHAYNTAGASPDSVCARVYTVDNDVTANITVSGNSQSQVTVVFRNAQIVDWDSTGYASGSPTQSIPTGYSTPGMGVLLVNRYTPPSNPPNYTWLTNGSASVGYLDNISTQLAQPPALSHSGGTYSATMALMLAPVNAAPHVPSMNPTGTLAAPAVLATLTPTLNWSFSDPDVGNSQKARQLKIYDGATLIYDSGKVATGSMIFTYPSSGVTALQPDKVYGWEVIVWDNHDAASPYSTRQYFKTTKAPTVTPKSPLGTGALPLMISQTPRVQWSYADTENHVQNSFQVRIKRASDDGIAHESGLIISTNTYYDVPVGVLAAGVTYYWEVQVRDSTSMVSGFSKGQYFVINVPPAKPIPDHIPDTLRVGKRPVFEATINDDVENDAQAFVLQLATNSAFTENLLDFRSDFRIEGWEAFDGTVWDTFQPGGKIRPAQLVRDYGFEGVLGGIWKWDVGPLGTGDKINNAHEQKRNGNYSLRIVAASGNNIGVQQELKGWKPGDKVTLDAYVNITKYATGRLNVDLVAYDANGKNLIDTSGIVAEGITTGFTKFSDASITIPANTKTLLVRVFVDGTPNMTAYIDDVTVSIDGVKKYNKVRYTIGVDAYYGEPLTEGKAYYWRMAAKDGLTGTLSEWTDQQTLTNRLGTSGKCENAADWGAYNCTVTTDTTNKVDGNASIKVTATNKNVAAAFKDVGGWKAGKYYVILGFIKNGNAEKGARIIPSGPTYSASWQIYDKTKFNFYWCKTAPTTDYPGNLDLGFSPTEAGQYAYFDQVRVYEISKAEYELISVDPSWSGELLALRYPYVDNTQTIPRKTRIRCGTTLALQTKPIKTTAPVDRSVFSKFAMLPIHVPAVKRIENTDSRITYSSGGLAWNNINYVDAGSSEGTSAYVAGTAGAWAELSFIGTGIRFGSWLSPWYGLVDVYIDDVLVKTVSQYVPEGYVGDTKQQIVYENTKLPYGPHKIKIVNRNEKVDPAALGMSCALDFFEILDTRAPAVLTVQSSNNANDATPTWEDVTDVFLSGDYYRYKNMVKTAPEWGLALKITVDAKERLGPIEIDGFGISYE